MSLHLSPLAGLPAPTDILVDVDGLIAAYTDRVPDPAVPAQRVAFGTSGHRGSSFQSSFNEWHVLAIAQAVCNHRRSQGITGPLFLGLDTHALSAPAGASVLQVLAANGVDVMLAEGDEYTPTPAISHAILAHNRNFVLTGSNVSGLADGIVVTPSHNPPDSGGIKYNPPHGGPAEQAVTSWIENAANDLLAHRLDGVSRLPIEQALRAATTHRHDYIGRYVADLGQVVDMDLIRSSGLRIGVDPLGGAGVHYWARIAERHGIDLTVVSDVVDPAFRFMTVDWDGKIRMDPSSPWAMRRLVQMKDRFDVAFACDADHDRHGIVSASAGLMPANHYLSVMVDHLLRHRPQWNAGTAVAKTVVTTRLIADIAARRGRQLVDMPAGFKWFAAGLADGTLGFAGEESAGASFLRRDGSPWTTDKDGLVPALLAAEITAAAGRDPGECYAALTRELGAPAADRIDAAATPTQKKRLSAMKPSAINATELAGERITAVIDRAPGNGESIGGIKVVTASGWFAARPSGTEDIYKIYAESFNGETQLRLILAQAQQVVDIALAAD
jgi:phosphoglucomutase